MAANTYMSGGQRFAPYEPTQVNLDAIAQSMGYPDFATFQANDPEQANAVASQYPQFSGSQQVAANDELNPWFNAARFIAPAIATAGIAAPVFAGAGGAAAAGGSAAPAAGAVAPISASVPTTVGLGGLSLPTATLGAAPALGAAAAPIASASQFASTAPYTTQAGDIGGAASSSTGGGIFSTLGKILAPIAGPLIGAGASIYGASKAAAAAKDAAELQAKANQAALDFAKAQYADQYRQYEQTQANLGPYRDLGYSSLGALAKGLNLPEPAAPQNVPATLLPPSFASLPGAGALTPSAPGFGSGPLRSPNGTPAPPMPTAPAAASKTVAQFAPYASPNGGASGTIYMKAPDGTVKAVPQDQASHFLQLGATYV